MSLSENETRAHKIISETLQLVNVASLDPRILYKVPIKVLIGRSGFGPEITVEFLGINWKKKTIQAEIAFFLGGPNEVDGHVTISLLDEEAHVFEIIEHVNPTTMNEFELYFEKVMAMYAELEDQK